MQYVHLSIEIQNYKMNNSKWTQVRQFCISNWKSKCWEEQLEAAVSMAYHRRSLSAALFAYEKSFHSFACFSKHLEAAEPGGNTVDYGLWLDVKRK